VGGREGLCAEAMQRRRGGRESCWARSRRQAVAAALLADGRLAADVAAAAAAQAGLAPRAFLTAQAGREGEARGGGGGMR
jgi:hypothetical protein